MKEGMTGANAPQVLLEVESVIIFYTWKISLCEWDIAVLKPWIEWPSYRLGWVLINTCIAIQVLDRKNTIRVPSDLLREPMPRFGPAHTSFRLG